MRKEIEDWWLQSQDDFDAAEYNFSGGKYFVAAFLCQQAVEKALKALFLQETKGSVPQSHSLIYLGTNTSLPQRFHSFLRQLTPKYVDTRYPDAAVDLPSRIYDADNTRGLLENSKEIIEWVRKSLTKQ